MWFPLIFILLCQGYLTVADPIPSVGEPHNAFSWLKQNVLMNDTSPETSWLRELMVSDPQAADSWIRESLTGVQNVMKRLVNWFANDAVMLPKVRIMTAEETWWIDHILNSNEDAESWENSLAGRNDTSEAFDSLKDLLKNETQTYVKSFENMSDEEFERVAMFTKTRLEATSAEDLVDDETSSSDDSWWLRVAKARTNGPHNAFWWVKQAIITDPSNETQWLREGLAEHRESAMEWMKQALRNTRETVALINEAIKNETGLNHVEVVEEGFIWYVDQALDDSQDTKTWKALKAGRNDTEKAMVWIRGALTNQTQEIFTWMKDLVSDGPQDTESIRTRILIAALAAESDEDSTSTSSDEEVDAIWTRFVKAKNDDETTHSTSPTSEV